MPKLSQVGLLWSAGGGKGGRSGISVQKGAGLDTGGEGSMDGWKGITELFASEYF